MLKGVLLNVCSIDHILQLDYMEWALEIICFVIRCIAISKKSAQNNILQWIKHLNDPNITVQEIDCFYPCSLTTICRHVHSFTSTNLFLSVKMFLQA